jgi:hypothetical protein
MQPHATVNLWSYKKNTHEATLNTNKFEKTFS